MADDLVITVLREIREELREHGTILREHSTILREHGTILREHSVRFESIDARFGAVEGVLQDIGGQMVIVGRALRSALDSRSEASELFEDLENRVSALEQRFPP